MSAPYSACLAGLKGAVFLRAMIEAGRIPQSVQSYEQKGDRSAAFEEITTLCKGAGVKLTGRSDTQSGENTLFFVGWQYRTERLEPRHAVFHDSLLPKYRGFSPTVAALLAGDTQMGVTLFRPNEDVDCGPILAQAVWNVNYPCTLERALRTQAQKMAELALTFLNGDTARAGVAQTGAGASYSVWRDEADYRIDWSRPAAEIKRFIDAVGFPFAGASTMLDGQLVRVVAATEATDLPFVERRPGKVWSLANGAPTVICGEGLLRLDQITDDAGTPVGVTALRTRFA